jgi:alkanesulfonate monooxygenase SsuD/methylene tetrahydromethanopterin reductase-like flavin-dependent oxidoreductase (luciferase family)
MSPRPFRFSLQAFEAPSAAAWITTCRRAEELGYVTDDQAAAADAMAARFGVTGEALLHHPHALIGSVDQICDTLIERRERLGVSYLCIAQRHLEEFAPVVQRLANT